MLPTLQKRMSSSRSLSRETIALTIIVLFLIGIGFAALYAINHTAGPRNQTSSSASSSYSFSLTNALTNDSSWSSFHGANYAWGALGIQCCANPPSTDFPLMSNLGFNLIRVPLSWNTYALDSTTYTGYLIQIANEADKLGLHIVYDAHSNGGNEEPGFFFPSSMSKSYGNDSTFFLNWWADKVTYNSSSGWNALWNDFWLPVISTVNTHSSTFGYEIENEPQPDGAPLSQLQSYNQFVANHIRSITSKYIVFMGPYDSLTTSSDEAVAPKSITDLVMDVHCYIGTDSQPGACAQNGGVGTNLANVADVGATLGVKIWIGEWAVCNPGGCSVTQAQASSIIQSYVAQFKLYNFSNTYWAWKCDTNPATVGQTDLLTGYPGCNTYWLDNELSQVEG